MRCTLLLAALAMFAGPLYAAAPSDASVRTLLETMGSQKMVDAYYAQIDALMQSSIQKSAGGKPLTAREQAAVAHMQSKTMALMKEEMSWAKMEPILADAYKQTFTQKEIDGMQAFYSSDIGRAVIAKMPQVMQNNMQAMQKTMANIAPRLQKIQQDMHAELNATD